MWNNDDFINIQISSKQIVGQIQYDSSFGKEIISICKNLKYKTFLEIGTWNGMGSTRCFYEGLKDRTDDWIFFSLETNKDKCQFAKSLYSQFPKIKILNTTILKELPSIDKIREISDEIVDEWLKVDIENLNISKNSNDILPSDICFDVVLLDGSEYLTYFEYQQLKDKTHCFMLDDVNTSKCKKIYLELMKDNRFKILSQNLNERNGWAIFSQDII